MTETAAHPVLERRTVNWDGARLAASDAEKAGWRRDKFVVLRRLVPRPPLEALAREVLEAYRAHCANASARLGGDLSGHVNFDAGVRGGEIASMLEERGLLQFVGELFGEQVAWSASGGNLNLPGSHPQHYHMDSNYHDEFVPVMVALTPTSIENGAIELVAESAQWRLRYAEFWTGNLSRNGVRIPMDVGDVLIRSSCLWHRGTPNFTERPRPMLTLGLHRASQVAPAFDPFVVREIKFDSNFYSAGLSGKVKEAFVVHAPWLYNAVRAAKSLFARADAST